MGTWTDWSVSKGDPQQIANRWMLLLVRLKTTLKECPQRTPKCVRLQCAGTIFTFLGSGIGHSKGQGQPKSMYKLHFFLTCSTASFPILSRDPSFQETIKNPGKQLVIEKNDGWKEWKRNQPWHPLSGPFLPATISEVPASASTDLQVSRGPADRTMKLFIETTQKPQDQGYPPPLPPKLI